MTEIRGNEIEPDRDVTPDPEEQDPVFEPSPRPRAEKSSGYYDEPSSPRPPSVGKSPCELDDSINSKPSSPLPSACHIAKLPPHVLSIDPTSSMALAHLSQRPQHQTFEALPTLPPPPVELQEDTNFSFACDICGETVKVCTPREWQ